MLLVIKTNLFSNERQKVRKCEKMRIYEKKTNIKSQCSSLFSFLFHQINSSKFRKLRRRVEAADLPARQTMPPPFIPQPAVLPGAEEKKSQYYLELNSCCSCLYKNIIFKTKQKTPKKSKNQSLCPPERASENFVSERASESISEAVQ